MMMEKQEVPVIICFNKMDLAKEKELKLLDRIYENCGHQVMFVSVRQKEGIEKIRHLIQGKQPCWQDLPVLENLRNNTAAARCEYGNW